MNPLQTDNLIALSLLLDEDIYVLNDLPKKEFDQIVAEKPVEVSAKTTETNNSPVVEIPKIEKQTIPSPSPEVSPATIIPKIEKASVPLKTKNDGFEYLGENNKYILIIVNNEQEKFLNKADLAFLVKIMGAKKWVLEDVAIVNMAKYEDLNFEDLTAYFACNKIVTFGFNPAVLNIVGAVANQKTTYKNVAVLGTWDLPKLQTDVPKKTIFWNQLKAF
ncbi:hypothetical protein [Pedobacter arcticus]|uniref:hypothetical protein n=1 Tax=Pedobacter arcticus TaxID=752140 RepID=UPI0002DFF844|nr:hypothetical protein [Pedobacter arcticus]